MSPKGSRPWRRVFAGVALVGMAMLGFGQYLQHGLGIEPCPMCIVQRYALIFIVLCAGLTALGARKGYLIAGGTLVALGGMAGAYVAARQSWLQWYPPEVVSCGRDFYGMIENFPLQRAIPMIFKGSGDCSKVDWSFLGGSLANWSFICFCVFAGLGLMAIVRVWRTR